MLDVGQNASLVFFKDGRIYRIVWDVFFPFYQLSWACVVVAQG